ncbi:hypothetical protein FRC08_017837 [Ceratobasidium sp. 394]|nr:hypothetical protein FRC08_017837 [Ceratobasidium sp. 394]
MAIKCHDRPLGTLTLSAQHFDLPTVSREYSGAQEGQLSNLLQSVGLPVPPPPPELKAAEQAKKQRAIAKARGNATQPGPLAPLTKRRKASDNVPLTDLPFDDVAKEDRVEWLLQALDSFGYPNYRRNPELHDWEVLYKVYDALMHGEHPEEDEDKGGEGDDVRSALVPDHPIHTGLTRVLEHQKSGHRPAAKLVRTDSQTMLGGLRINSGHNVEFGQWEITTTRVAPPAPLARTDRTTIGLDGAPPSPPQALAASRRGPTTGPLAKPSAENLRPAPTSRTTAPLVPTPSAKKPSAPPNCAVVSRARVEVLRQENKARSQGTTKEDGTGASVRAKGASVSQDSRPNPSSRKPQVTPTVDVDVDMADRSLSDEEAPPLVGQRRASAAVEGDNSGAEAEVEGSNPDADGKGSDDDEDGDDDEPVRSRKSREAKLLSSFGKSVSPLIKYVVATLKLEMAVTCGFPEHVRSPDDPENHLVELWIQRFWDDGHNKLRASKPRYMLRENHGLAARSQLSPIRGMIKTATEPMIGMAFGLDRGNPDHAVKAAELTDDERWLLPNLANDGDIFMNPIIENAIYSSFFRSTRSIGSKNIDQFTPLVPLETIAYVCAIIRHLIAAFKVSDEKANHLDSSGDAEQFRIYMRMLKELGERDEVALQNVRVAITLKYMRVRSPPTTRQPVKLNLGPKKTVNVEATRELQTLLGENAPGFALLAGPSLQGQKEQKGKGRG